MDKDAIIALTVKKSRKPAGLSETLVMPVANDAEMVLLKDLGRDLNEVLQSR